MVVERFKRLVLLIVVLTPVVFGGLAISNFLEVQEWTVTNKEWGEKYKSVLYECDGMKDWEKWNNSCTDRLQLRREAFDSSLKSWVEAEEKYQLHKSVAIYVPLATLALYFAVMWIWFGKVPNFKEHNINLTEITQAAYKHRVTLGYCALAIVGLFVSMAFWENKYVQNMAIGGGVGVAVGLVVAVSKLLFNKK